MWGGPNNFFSRVGGMCPPANVLWRRPCILHTRVRVSKKHNQTRSIPPCYTEDVLTWGLWRNVSIWLMQPPHRLLLSTHTPHPPSTSTLCDSSSSSSSSLHLSRSSSSLAPPAFSFAVLSFPPPPPPPPPPLATALRLLPRRGSLRPPLCLLPPLPPPAGLGAAVGPPGRRLAP